MKELSSSPNNRSPKLSILICTYDRYNILQVVLSEILRLIQDLPIELIVINNAPHDDLKSRINRNFTTPENMRIIDEKRIGLSHARNRAVRESRGEWVIFIDDDAKPHKDLFEHTFKHINKKEEKVVGGVYYPWFFFGKPKWFKNEYGSNKMKYAQVTKLKKNEFVSGGILLINKNLFEIVGYFSDTYGMSGKNIGYGEEIDWQIRARAKCVKIYYDPNMIVYHAVLPHKLHVHWHIKSGYIGGKSIASYVNENKIFYLLKSIVLFFGQTLVYPVVNSLNLIHKDYFLENWIIDSFRKPAKRLGATIQTLQILFAWFR